MTVSPRKNQETRRWVRFRIGVVAAVLGLAFTVIVGRVVQLGLLSGTELSEKATEQVKKAFKTQARRGTIYDRNYGELAVSIDMPSVCAYPKRMASPAGAAKALAKALKLDYGSLKAKVTSGKPFVWIKRQASPKEVAAVKKLDLEGVNFVTEGRRFYPLTHLASQVIGFCGTDGRGLEGLEYYYDTFLRGRDESRTLLADALGRAFEAEDDPSFSHDGLNLVLTIDKNIQHIAEEALADGVAQYSAKAGMAVVMEPDTGAILAVAYTPQFNPNVFRRYERSVWRNRVITDSFEPGSTFKIFLAAAALESGRVTPDSTFDCEHGTYRVGRNVVHDVHEYDVLSLQDIIKYSSNIGAAKIGERIGAPFLYGKLKTFGFGAKTGVDCPGETAGALLPVEKWTDIDARAVCFGQGISVSALQLAAAVSAVANNGVLMKPYLVQAMTNKQGRPVRTFQAEAQGSIMSSRTAGSLTAMLERVVAKTGTGPQAAVRGYRVAGKTGTAQKVDPGTKRYASGKYVASFVGFLPAGNPKLTILVAVDEPHKTHYGGVVAGPVFSRIALETLQYLKIPPDLAAPEEGQGSFSASREVEQAG